MTKKQIFISSVQSEFSEERKSLAEYIRQDALFSRYFEPFLFEELPAQDISAQQAYLGAVARTDIYLALIGKRYGYEDAAGVSPTEREYDTATANSAYRLAFIKDVQNRENKEELFIQKIEHDITRNPVLYGTFDDLRNNVYAALIHYLTVKGLLVNGPIDSAIHPLAKLSDLDNEKIRWFVGMAREKRRFPFQYSDENIHTILSSLHLITDDDGVTNSALLLFAKDVQKWFPQATVKCVQFYGTHMEKPILSQQLYDGNVFEVVDRAVDFVLSRIDAHVGERTQTAQVDVSYELPVQAVTEAIVNAVVHRDYASTGSVQVMLFKDRLEVWNPGRLPQGITIVKLGGEHQSIPVNPLLARPVYLVGYIEQLGTGTTDLINRCVGLGLKRPEFKQDESFVTIIWRKEISDNTVGLTAGNAAGNEIGKDVGNEIGKDVGKEIGKDALSDKGPNRNVLNLINVIGKQQLTLKQMMEAMSFTSPSSFHKTYLDPAIDDGYVTKIYPDKPTHKEQAYSLTEKGLKIWKKSRKK